MDNLSPEERSKRMALVKDRDTKPELAVRSMLHRMGYRFRIHRHDLPGRPDIVLSRHRTAVFVHGCFWHGHDCRRGSREPLQNAEYWKRKRLRNVARDEASTVALIEKGWRVLIVWECEIRDKVALEKRLRDHLGFKSDGST